MQKKVKSIREAKRELADRQGLLKNRYVDNQIQHGLSLYSFISDEMLLAYRRKKEVLYTKYA